jgi:hypothetical protein
MGTAGPVIGVVIECRGCGMSFSLCRSCFYGRRYCSARCRSIRRREQVRAAGRRNQSTQRGREKHRARQQKYRDAKRSAPKPKAPVTHQGSPASKAAVDSSLAHSLAPKSSPSFTYPHCTQSPAPQRCRACGHDLEECYASLASYYAARRRWRLDTS